MTQELAVRPTTVVAVHDTDYSEEQWAMVRRLVRLRQGQPEPNPAQLALMVQEAAHLDLDPFAGECYFINLGDGWVTYPHWSGLLKLAEATGEYEGADGPWYSGDGKDWVEAWAPKTPPAFCKVTVHRANHVPTTVVVKWDRVNRETPIWRKDPEGMLAKAALRLAWRRAFPREVDRPLSPKQLKALQTVASLSGLRDRDARLAAASDILGKPIGSFKELSAAEATELYDELSEQADEMLPEEAGEQEAPAAAERMPDGGGALGEVDPAPSSGSISEDLRALGEAKRAAAEPEPPSTLDLLMEAVEAVRARRKPVIVDGWLAAWLANEKLEGMAYADEDQAQRGLDWIRAQFPRETALTLNRT